MSLHRDITGVILAGGKSRRLGRDKAFLTVDGEAFVTRIARTMRRVFSRILVIGNVDNYRFLNLPFFADIYRECGPLGGIHSGLLHSKTRSSFVVACDTPFITAELIEHIIGSLDHADVVIPSTKKGVHPLCGLYTRRCIPVIEENLRNGKLRVQDCLSRMHTIVVPITPRLPFHRSDLLLNVNELKDYELAVQSLTHRFAASS